MFTQSDNKALRLATRDLLREHRDRRAKWPDELTPAARNDAMAAAADRFAARIKRRLARWTAALIGSALLLACALVGCEEESRTDADLLVFEEFAELVFPGALSNFVLQTSHDLRVWTDLSLEAVVDHSHAQRVRTDVSTLQRMTNGYWLVWTPVTPGARRQFWRLKL